MRRLAPIFVLLALLCASIVAAQGNPVVQWQAMLTTINQMQATITALQNQIGAGTQTSSVSTILDEQPQSGQTIPLFNQAASQNTAYTLYTYTLQAGALGTNKAITVLGHLQYSNSVSSDAPQFTVSYGGTNIVSGAIPLAIPSSATASEIWLECDLVAGGSASAETGNCFAVIGGVGTIVGGNHAMAENSAIALPINIKFTNGASANSTIRSYAIRTVTGAGTGGSTTVTGGGGSSFTGTFTGPLSLTGTGGVGLQNVPIGGTTANTGKFTSLTSPLMQTSSTNPAVTGLLNDSNNHCVSASRNATNNGDICDVSSDLSNNTVLGTGAAGIKMPTALAISPTTQTLTGTAGQAACTESLVGTLKIGTCYLNGYAQTGTAQVYNFPTPFVINPYAIAGCGTYGPSLSAAAITLPANANMTAETCSIIVLGQ